MSEPTLHIVLHEPEIPFNTGSVGRTCVAAGAKLWLVRPLGFRLDDRYLRRAGLDYWQHLDYEIADDWQDLTARLGERTIWCFSKRAERTYWNADFTPGCALAFGSETRGLPDSILQHATDNALRIPLEPEARSLNLSNAVGVATYEALRQFTATPTS